MQMAMLFAVVLALAFVCLKVLFPSKSKPSFAKTGTHLVGKVDRRAGSRSGNPFHAVSIHPPAGGCQAAQEIKGARFLSDEAPGLPLEGCTAEHCQCRYAHHVDRRRGNGDRRLAFGLGHDMSVSEETERRTSTGRRGSDEPVAA